VVLIPNPGDCGRYYDCTHGTPIPTNYPGGVYFCNELQTCVYKTDDTCSYDCIGIKSKPVIVEKQFVPYDDLDCPAGRNDTVTLIPHPTNCTAYYLRDNGVAKPMPCPPGLYFCVEKETCDGQTIKNAHMTVINLSSK
jgi:hypothetical protein